MKEVLSDYVVVKENAKAVAKDLLKYKQAAELAEEKVSRNAFEKRRLL